METKRPCILCDIDGTVADITHRMHHIDDCIREGDLVYPKGVSNGKHISYVYIEPDGDSGLTWVKDTFDGKSILVSGQFKKRKSWRKFFEACPLDSPIEKNIDIVKILAGKYPVVFMSGRPVTYIFETIYWFEKHKLNGLSWPIGQYKLPSTELYMRPAGDHREDYIVKEELYRKHIEPYYDVQMVLDDRKQVVDMWRRLGLNCWAVADGNF